MNDGRKTGVWIALVALGLCVGAGVLGLALVGGMALLRGGSAISPTPLVVQTPPPAPPRSAGVKGFAIGAEAITDTTLSTFVGDDLSCQWERIDPLANRTEPIAAMEGSCSGARVAWSPDGTKGIVWLDPLEDGWKGTAATDGDAGRGGDRMWLVTFANGTFTALPRPPVGEVMELAFDHAGNAIAITSEEISDEDASRGFVEIDVPAAGREKLSIPEGEGLPILAHAFRLDAGAGGTPVWTATETKASNDGADLSIGVRVLEVWKELGPRTDQILDGQPKSSPIEDKLLAGKLAALTAATDGSPAPEDDGTPEADATADGDGSDGAQDPAPAGEWRQLQTAAGPVYLWEEQAEGLFATGLIAFPDGDKVVRPEKLEMSAADAAAPTSRGTYFLITGQDGEDPHLYDLRTRNLVWTDDKATGTVFWPK